MALNVSTTANISSTATYKLVNAWSLGSLALEPGTPNLQLRAKPDNSTDDDALAFQFRTSDSSGSFNLCAAVKGQTYCLDVYNEQKTVPHMTPFGYYAGQYWTVAPTEDGDGTVRLSNEWTGAGWFMDLYEGSYEAFMSEGGDYAGHYWMLEQVAEDVALPPNAPTIDDNSTTTSAGSSSGNGSSGLSTPAIIGISLAGGILSATVVLVTIALLFRRRRKRRRQARNQQQQDDATAGGASPTAHHHNDRQQLTRSPDSRTLLNPTGGCCHQYSTPGGGPTTPQTAYLNNDSNNNGLPLEMESPLEPRDHAAPRYESLSYFPPPPHHNGSNAPPPPQQQPHRPSIYELPANNEQDIIAISPPKPTYASSLHHGGQHGGQDEKDATLFHQHHYSHQTMDSTTSPSSSLPTSPVSTRSRTTAPRATARWQEVVPDGRGEVVFDTNGVMASRHASARSLLPRGVAVASREERRWQPQPPPQQLWTNGTIPTWPPPSWPPPSLSSSPSRTMSPSYDDHDAGSPTSMGGETFQGGSWYSGGGAGTMVAQQRQQQQRQQQSQQVVGELDALPSPGFAGWGTICEADAGVDGDVGRQLVVHEAGGREVVRLVDLPPSPEREREREMEWKNRGW